MNSFDNASPGSSTPPSRRFWPWLLPVAALATWSALPLWKLVLADDRLPQWDMAKHGLSGLRIAQALERLDIVEVVARISEMNVWPPLFAILETPAFLVGGSGFAVPRLLVVALFILTVPAAFWAGRQMVPSAANLSGAVAAALVATSPVNQVFGALVMLEIPGVLFQILAAGLYARSLSSGEPRHFRLACLTATLLFFTKYNYGLIWILALLLAEWLRDREWSLAGMGRELGRRVSGIGWRRPWTWFLIAYGGLLLSIVATGGWQVEIAGKAFRATSLGNPVYILGVLVFLRFCVAPVRNWGRLRAAVERLADRQRIMVLWIGLPILVWMAVPSHTKNFFGFVENRSSGIPVWSGENWLFYPRALLFDFVPQTWIGVLALGTFIAATVLFRRLSPQLRGILLAALLGGGLLLLHSYKQPRFAVTVAVLVWLLTGAMLARLWTWIAQRMPDQYSKVVSTVLALMVLLGATLLRIPPAELEREIDLRSVPAAVSEPLTAVAQVVAGSEEAVLVGYWNGFSPALVEWRLRQTQDETGDLESPLDVKTLGAESASEFLDRLASPRFAGAMIVDLRLRPKGKAWRDAYEFESGHLDDLRAGLRTDSRFSQVLTRRFSTSGYQMTIYRVASVDSRLASFGGS